MFGKCIAVETEHMPKLFAAGFRMGGSKPKNRKGKSKPNSEPGPKTILCNPQH